MTNCPKCGYRHISTTSGIFYCGQCGYSSGTCKITVSQITTEHAHFLELENKRLHEENEKLLSDNKTMFSRLKEEPRKGELYLAAKHLYMAGCDVTALETKNERLKAENDRLKQELKKWRESLNAYNHPRDYYTDV